MRSTQSARVIKTMRVLIVMGRETALSTRATSNSYVEDRAGSRNMQRTGGHSAGAGRRVTEPLRCRARPCAGRAAGGAAAAPRAWGGCVPGRRPRSLLRSRGLRRRVLSGQLQSNGGGQEEEWRGVRRRRERRRSRRGQENRPRSGEEAETEHPTAAPRRGSAGPCPGAASALTPGPTRVCRAGGRPARGGERRPGAH